MKMRRPEAAALAVDRSRANVIVSVDGRSVKSFDDLLTYVESKKPGDKVTFHISRDGKRLDVPVEQQQSRN